MNFWVWGIFNLFDHGLVRYLLDRLSPNETGRAALIGGAFALCVILPYLLGSINCALLISRYVYHDDIRKYGSGNAGSTNMLRTYGKKASIVTFIGDGLKGVLSVIIACLLFGSPESEPFFIYLVTAAYLSAFFCVFGHIFPCFAHFRGGKGFATSATVIIVLNPVIAAILACIFFPLVAVSRYISLGSVMAVLIYPILLASFDKTQAQPYGVPVIFALLIAAAVTFAHRGNIVRIFNHTERKLVLKKDKVKEEGTASAPDDKTDA